MPIRLYSQIDYIDGLNPSICQSERFRWTSIRLSAKLGNIDGSLPAYIPLTAI
jgi:hypothetical protein